MSYKVILARSAEKELARLPNKTQEKIIAHIYQLELNPRTHGVEKLAMVEGYKLRVGNYRIIFEIDDASRKVRVVMIDDRKQVYKKLRRKR
jgi:mRNA interferase RelE/StbE